MVGYVHMRLDWSEVVDAIGRWRQGTSSRLARPGNIWCAKKLKTPAFSVPHHKLNRHPEEPRVARCFHSCKIVSRKQLAKDDLHRAALRTLNVEKTHDN